MPAELVMSSGTGSVDMARKEEGERSWSVQEGERDGVMYDEQ